MSWPIIDSWFRDTERRSVVCVDRHSTVKAGGAELGRTRGNPGIETWKASIRAPGQRAGGGHGTGMRRWKRRSKIARATGIPQGYKIVRENVRKTSENKKAGNIAVSGLF
ncbi:hypothetical protein [Cupriavidus sp. RAF12]|uniref:hypothetical protein n=1 Tax=Cupriavidus sp. RAF12 TaxID=3233050 RepID=UPI003F91DA48